MKIEQNRRGFLAGLAAMGVLGLADLRGSAAEEAPLETTSVRFAKASGICIAPQFVAEDMIRAAGLSFEHPGLWIA